MIRSLYRAQEGDIRTGLKLDELGTVLQDARGLLWLDFVAEQPDVCEPILRETFGFHPLAIEDALHQTHVPKVDDWTEYLYMVLHAVVFDDSKLDSLELDVFLGPNYIVTYSEQPISAVDRVWEVCQRDERYLARGADHLLYQLVDEIVAESMSAVDDMDEAIGRIEDEIFERPTSETLGQIFTLKRAALRMRRTLVPQREVLNKLARDEYPVIDARDRAYFRDVYDHLVRLYDINESLRDLVTGALDIYLSVVNNRMNEAMKMLAIVTTLFMPISFLAGFFGMNFFRPVAPLDGWTSTLALVLALVVMLLVPLGMYLWIRRRGWM
jgi:magnesium transporter